MSEPIALPLAAHAQQDYNMDQGSYNGDSGHFNPASYTRHFLGSPISWRAGSFGAQYCTSQSPTAMLVGSYDPVKSPQDSSILNAWNIFDRQGELCRNYTCCGTHLPDLHALLEHFEEVHIVVVDRSQPPQIQVPFNPQTNPPEMPQPTTASQPPNHQPAYSTPFDTDDMDLGLDYDDSSPPPPSTAPTSTVTSRAPSPSISESGVQRPALNLSLNVGFPFREGMHTPLSARGPAPFNAYARYNSDYDSPNGTPSQEIAEFTPDSNAIAPALVFATGEELQPEPEPVASTSTITPVASTSSKPPKAKRTPPSPPVASPISAAPSRVSTPMATSSSVASSVSSTPTPAAPSILLPHKPFRCPKPNCSKSYKQANGLKYHMTHGSCNFGPAKDVEAVRALLERKRATAAATVTEEEDDSSAAATPKEANTESAGLSQAEINEVEARVRPFACGVGDCSRRYKNMNGLRYHYQHSGDHGAVGLSLLAGGVHGCLKPGGGAGKAAASSASASTSAVNATTTTATTPAYAWGSTLLPHIRLLRLRLQMRRRRRARGRRKPHRLRRLPRRPVLPQQPTPEYLAQQLQLQRAQYAQYQQAVAAGWYTPSQSQSGTPQTQVDVQMG
ncbi:hypothetical protein FB45DRAFT_1053939 [Roridomyces roridus]|uniref:C2H2-type domain-containing protein n=1 Tax=Roridomyces roridus TaxID=1738132 RepID=A0AAD7C7H9_9AGAR|nr:hypothetical protein FB45DRAFT_1053939 [Roridomyces roridus]